MVSFTPVLTIDEVVKIESKSRTVKTIRQGGEKKKEKKKKQSICLIFSRVQNLAWLKNFEGNKV